jgi:selenocysteine lyase/cysteine desulfurase
MLTIPSPLRSIAGLGYAIDYLTSFGGGANGTGAIQAHNLKLRALAFRGMAALNKRHPNVTIIGATTATGPLVSKPLLNNVA